MNLNRQAIRAACLELGYQEPISIEDDGTVWLGTDDNRTYPEMAPINAKAAQIEGNYLSAHQSGQNKLKALGLTDEELFALGL